MEDKCRENGKSRKERTPEKKRLIGKQDVVYKATCLFWV
jgi:hypothetical protein